ncbi:hypothetical protein ACQ4M3_19080 [Leptolyngbya sp. AN03gr2]|uniref:hypothetical protein n=1 Tax=Leptolyngbya sp. AN03gr2 TaxID=3423364 RepID=UPI003D316440
MKHFLLRYSSSLLGKYNRLISSRGQDENEAKEKFCQEFKKLHGQLPLIHEVIPRSFESVVQELQSEEMPMTTDEGENSSLD